MADMDKRPENGFSIDKIITLCKRNVRYLSGGVLMVALVAALALTTSCKSGGENAQDDKVVTQMEGQNEDAAEDAANTDNSEADSPKEEVDEHPEITELISTYYNSYAAGDLDKLSGIAKKLSDMEKDYIKMMNEHVESYGDVSCTVTDGAKEGTYIVSVVYDMKFAGMADTLPGMNVFYVQTDKKGNLYINNRYSSFNRELQEQKTKKKILTLMETFENSDAVKKLQQEVQREYDAKVAANEDLQKKLNEVAEAIANWKDNYAPQENNEEEQQPKEEPKQPEEQPEENTDDGQADDGQQTDDSQQADDGQADDGQQADDGSQDDGNTGLNYVPEGTVLTANDGYNVRKSMDETSELVGTTAVGDSIKVILSYAEGWTKVEWNGTTGYIRTDLLLSN